MAKSKHDKHSDKEQARITDFLVSQAVFEIPSLNAQLEAANKRIKELEYQLEHRMERAIAVLRGEDEEY